MANSICKAVWENVACCFSSQMGSEGGEGVEIGIGRPPWCLGISESFSL